MSRLQAILALGALLFALLTLVLPMGTFAGEAVSTWSSVPTLVFLAATLAAIGAFRLRSPTVATGLLAAVGCGLLIGWVEPMAGALAGFWALLVLTWLLCWLFAEQLSADIRRGKVNDGLVGWLVLSTLTTGLILLRIAPVLQDFVLGVIIGGIAGYYGGRIDLLIQRGTEVVQALPHIPPWLAPAAAVPPRIAGT